MVARIGYHKRATQPIGCMAFTSPTRITEQWSVSSKARFSGRPTVDRAGSHSLLAKPLVCLVFTSRTTTTVQPLAMTASFYEQPTAGKTGSHKRAARLTSFELSGLPIVTRELLQAIKEQFSEPPIAVKPGFLRTAA